jgi:hypothetical protein
MRPLFRVALVTLCAMGLGARTASAAPITVAELLWEVTLDPAPGCSLDDPTCAFSTFSLTYLWDGAEPAPTLTQNDLLLADGSQMPFFDLDSGFGFDQFALPGVPVFATLSTSFLFEGELVTLSATLAQPASQFASAVLTYSPAAAPVPEPGTLALVTLALAALIGRRAFLASLRS